MNEFGGALPLPVADGDFLDRLARRRSAPAQSLAAPGPAADQLARILEVAARTPDHGKLFPWRFVIIEGEAKSRLVAALRPLAEGQADPAKAANVLAKLANPPVSVLVVSRPVEGHKVPVWEQQLSAGAVCMNLSHAAAAFGFSASWITDWYSYDPAARPLLGLEAGEQVAGFVHLGTLAEPPLERPRPDMAEIVSRLD
ncbi:nitroreductase [Brevundimonas sp.]|uniref:nitroreductase family protein n=1 Tax=Brevundimonas sp. TaxID=1871086 RepID=UPI0025D8269A|nr:nitroreductase [Brevundimonas sp.]